VPPEVGDRRHDGQPECPDRYLVHPVHNGLFLLRAQAVVAQLLAGHHARIRERLRRVLRRMLQEALMQLPVQVRADGALAGLVLGRARVSRFAVVR